MLKLLITHCCIVLFLISSLTAAQKFKGYNYYSLKVMGEAVYGASDIRECWQTINKIRSGKSENWSDAWIKIAGDLEKKAYAYKRKGNFVSAGETFLRASNYYRTALVFFDRRANECRYGDILKRSVKLFKEFAKYHSFPILEVKIPYEGKYLPAYFCQSGKVKAPLLIIQMGLGGTKEEAYCDFAAYALRRGYNCLLVDGPGQGEARLNKLGFRHDWEKVVLAVTDFVFDLNCVDKEKIALIGFGFGAHLSARALAYEKRIQVGVLIGGMCNFHNMVMNKKIQEEDLDDLERAGRVDLEIEAGMEKDADLSNLFDLGIYSFMASTPSEWLKKSRFYNLESVIALVEAKVLVVGSDSAIKREGEMKMFFDSLKCRKSLLLFDRLSCADLYCQAGGLLAANAAILDWLDSNL